MILINLSPKDALKIFQPFLPIFVPVGIGCLLAVTEKEGINANFIDEQVEGNVLELISRYTKDIEKPYIFDFCVLTATFKNAIFLSRELKRLYPDSIVIFGSIHPTDIPDEVLSYQHIDFVIRGEGEKSLIELYKCLKEGREYNHINNLSYRSDGKIIHNDRLFILDNLDDYSPFPYHLFNPKNYDLGFLVSSRGCPYGCIFCSNRITTGRRYRYKSAEVVVNELDLLYHKYGRRSILFLDDNFLVTRERIYALIDEIKKRGFDKKMTFNFEARGDNVDYKLLKDLYDAGFRSIFFGLETASEEIMKTIKKGETVAECASAVKMSKEIGFHVSATFIYGLPGERHRDRMDCARLSNKLDLDMVRFNNATPYPGQNFTSLLNEKGG
jgi:anaerobic magnesium-protoporphyrin IX monomethyl ester cyclase